MLIQLLPAPHVHMTGISLLHPLLLPKNYFYFCRFIVHESLESSVVKGSATVFNFTDVYSLTVEQVSLSLSMIFCKWVYGFFPQAKNVSDHFPIEFQLQVDLQGNSCFLFYAVVSIYTAVWLQIMLISVRTPLLPLQNPVLPHPFQV